MRSSQQPTPPPTWPRRWFHRWVTRCTLGVVTLTMLACDRRVTAGSAGRSDASAARPNIVFVLLDDVRYDDVIGHPFAQLPNLTRLLREGASFDRFFTAAPLCSPSRAVFLTGQYPYRNGIVDNSERGPRSHQLVTFPRLLHDAGYHTGFFGKWHMSKDDDSPRPGFDRWVSFMGQGVYFNPTLNVDGAVVQATGYMTDILTDQAVAFIRTAPVDRPFLTFVSQKAVHPEIYPKQVRTFPPAPGDEGLYAADTVPHAPNWRAATADKPALNRAVDHADPRSPAGGLPDAVIKDRLRMLSAVDRSLGALRAALEAKGVLDNTVFIVTSDQGFFYGEFGLAQERRLAYEPSIRIPLIMRYPALARAGTTVHAFASNADIAPTMLALGQAPIPSGLDGHSLLRTFSDSTAVVRQEFLIQYYSDTEFPRVAGMGYAAIRTDRYKLIRYDSLPGMHELYDLQTDPFELHNLLPQAASSTLMRELTGRLNGLLRCPATGCLGADHRP